MPSETSCYLLPKEEREKFAKQLMQKYELIAPVRKDRLFCFEKISSASEIAFDFTNSFYPPKKYFLADGETFARYEFGMRHKFEPAEEHFPKKRLFFLMRPCDSNALLMDDRIFLNDFPDAQYAKRRANSIIISLQCNNPCNENAFCASIGFDKAEKGVDIEMKEFGKFYLLFPKTKEGKEIIKEAKLKKVDSIQEKKLICNKHLEKSAIVHLSETFTDEQPILDALARKCFDCGACTIVCPTCFCFEVKDENILGKNAGERKRFHSSCMFQSFTRIAGNYVFRKSREDRYKHRLFHKFVYYPKRFNEVMCTGCGRCANSCLANICEISGILNSVSHSKTVPVKAATPKTFPVKTISPKNIPVKKK